MIVCTLFYRRNSKEVLKGKGKLICNYKKKMDELFAICNPRSCAITWKPALTVPFLSLFSQRSDVEESPASIYETDEEESDTVSIFFASS